MPKAAAANLTKLPTDTVPSDDCVVEIDSAKYHPHAGEWVKVIRGPRSIQELKLGWSFNGYQVEIDALRADQEEERRELQILIERMPKTPEDEQTADEKRVAAQVQGQIEKQLQVLADVSQKRYDRITARYDQFAEDVAERLADWNWTNRLGKPLPAPDGTIMPLQGLAPEEIYYLRQVCSGEAPAERKNGSRS